MKVAKKLIKVLDSFEVSELHRILEAMEMQEYYISGHKNMCGGFELATAKGIVKDGYINSDTDEEFDAITIEMESGDNDGSRMTSEKVIYHMPCHVLGNRGMCLKDKLQTVEEE